MMWGGDVCVPRRALAHISTYDNCLEKGLNICYNRGTIVLPPCLYVCHLSDRGCLAQSGVLEMTDRIGQQFGNYRLVRLLGQGGFADVYLAEHTHLETLAAVKVLSVRLTSEHIESFRTEARTIARLIHPHIVRILDFGVEQETPYLLMDYAPLGPSNRYHPRGTRLPLSTVVTYVKQIAGALQYAHEKGV